LFLRFRVPDGGEHSICFSERNLVQDRDEIFEFVCDQRISNVDDLLRMSCSYVPCVIYLYARSVDLDYIFGKSPHITSLLRKRQNPPIFFPGDPLVTKRMQDKHFNSTSAPDLLVSADGEGRLAGVEG
jgi:hypothetical protein